MGAGVIFSLLFIYCFALVAAKVDLTNFNKLSDRYYCSQSTWQFHEALLECKQAGMNLVSLENEEKQFDLIKVLPNYIPTGGFWVGGARTDDRVWYWVGKNFTKVTFTNWGTGQPTNFVGDFFECMRLGNYNKYDEKYMWENIDCFAFLFFICEMDV
ncbi:macrophage mannose receptor 1-like [Cylas formicarius]|uniref:macrophage mannose receptor 1-like n=1 Tax=Cylas formicarius TaxID=197179 RepID=UPI002958B4B5|nr:macrophage mannose receptor 1-like [Cylas formicarius]